MISYETFTLRSKGYIDEKIQEKIRDTNVLIAGCGMGSTIAEIMLRSGFINIILADADEVSPHNLNRQNFVAEDIGSLKTTALARRLRSIYPGSRVTEFREFINPENSENIVKQADLIVDTIDFIDLPGVVSLYDAAAKMSKPVISAINAGFGAVALFYPPCNGPSPFRQLFDLPEFGPVSGISYSEKYMSVIANLAKHLNPQVVAEMSTALRVMEDGKPCPASQIAAGSFTAGTLAATIAVKFLSGKRIACIPNVIYTDLSATIGDSSISILE